ncbi:hypothetical protein VTN00DRAFT_1321 [Thermoascus crustaceus]|uniref:uncharacterized protein n=1 Tax=Thermoascus crustaceus TaxID=5088 RepID=UPI00374355E9
MEKRPRLCSKTAAGITDRHQEEKKMKKKNQTGDIREQHGKAPTLRIDTKKERRIQITTGNPVPASLYGSRLQACEEVGAQVRCQGERHAAIHGPTGDVQNHQGNDLRETVHHG